MKKSGFVVRKIESEKDLGDMVFLLKNYQLKEMLGLYTDTDENKEIDVIEKLTVSFMVVVHGRLYIEKASVWKTGDGTMIIEANEIENLFLEPYDNPKLSSDGAFGQCPCEKKMIKV